MGNQPSVMKDGRLKVCLRYAVTQEPSPQLLQTLVWRYVQLRQQRGKFYLDVYKEVWWWPLSQLSRDLTDDGIHCYAGREENQVILVLRDQPDLVMVADSQQERDHWLGWLCGAIRQHGSSVDPDLTLIDNEQDEFLNSWFPDLYNRSYIIPVKHFDQIHADSMNIADVSASVLTVGDCSLLETAQESKALDASHKTIHALFTNLKEHISHAEVMVMMTQACFSMYGSLATAASSFNRVSRTVTVSHEDIVNQKKKHVDLIIVNKQRGILVGAVQNVYVQNPSLARQKLQDSMTYLADAAGIVQEVVRTVPGADNVTVHTTLVLPNISRSQLVGQLQEAVQRVTCLCQDEMTSNESLAHWWETCWTPGEFRDINNNVYRLLLARFAIPSTMVEIYLTTQPRLQLKHEHDVVNAVGDVHGAEVFQAGLHQLSLFPTQAELLHFDCLDPARDDLKFLWGPPGTGKTILLELRSLQWMKHFRTRHIFILQTRRDGIASSYLVEYQLQQTLNAQQQRARQSGTNTQSAQCTFTHVDISGLWSEEWNKTIERWEVVLTTGWKETLYTELGLQQRGQSDTAIHIVADEAQGDVVAAVYQWLKEEGVTTVRLWAAGVEAFRDNNIPAALQCAVCHVTEPLRCPGPVVQEVMKADKIKDGKVPPYDVRWQLTGGPPVVQLHHSWSSNGHSKGDPWRCGLCIKNIAAMLKSLHVGEADEGRQGLSANDVFILGWRMDCANPEGSDWSPAPLIKALQENGYNVRTLSPKSTGDEVMTVVKRVVKPPAITVASERCILGLERKIVVYCEGVGGYVVGGADETGRLVSFSRTTALLVHIKV